jgi:cytochrome c-type biogenesis protein CcmE
MNRLHKVVVGALVVITSVCYLAFLGAASSWQYYLTVDETVADASELEGRRIRVSGHVAPGSLQIADGRRKAVFLLAGERHELQVSCRCVMPDNLADDMDVVVEGVLEADCLRSHKVITRCAS